MKIAIVAESFLPHMNGVTGSIMQALKHLSGRGHELAVIAPDAGRIDADLHGARTTLLKSVPLPSYPEVRLVFATQGRIASELQRFGADVVHMASPFVLGWSGVRAADHLEIPAVSVYQTDITAYTAKYGLPKATPLAAAHIARLHRRSTMTLVPSSSARTDLERLGVDRIRHWGRGVDADRFAPDRRNSAWRHEVADGRLLIGYVGRLAPEKQVEDLHALNGIPGTRLVIVGDGPSRAALEAALPDAHFTGFLGGSALAEVMASFDVFVHPGESDTFGQTVQESLASGVPVVATGTGGPTDLVNNSINGWLYRPGDLREMRTRVEDLLGDASKRAAFSQAARMSVRNRTWATLIEQLESHYEEAIALRRLDSAQVVRASFRPDRPAQRSGAVSRATASDGASDAAVLPVRWRKYVAVGDSITEGLCDTSRMPEGEFLGWAARLAMLLAHANVARDASPSGTADHGSDGISFANLAVRSRRMHHLEGQVDEALRLEPDLVSVLIGANDLLLARVNIDVLAMRLSLQISRLRAAGIDVILGTPFLPRRRSARVIAGRFAEFNARIRKIAADQGCHLLDVDTIPEIGDLDMWAEDRVHLASAGHRLLAYRAAAVLGVPDASALGQLEHALHDDSDADEMMSSVSWLRAHALPWMWRRVRGRTAGDGLTAKHDRYIEVSDHPIPETY